MSIQAPSLSVSVSRKLLNLSTPQFFICKMGIIKLPTSKRVVRIKVFNMHRACNTLEHSGM